jgi:hypothetical protein
MQKYPLIFSSEWKYRLLRHILFWLSWWLFGSILYSFSPAYNLKGTDLNAGYFHRLYLTSINALFYLPQHIFLAYTLMYYVVPGFILKGKYVRAAFVTLLVLVITGAMSVIIGNVVINPFWKSAMPHSGINLAYITDGRLFNDLIGGLRGGITIGGFAAAIKLMKHHYVKEQRNLELQKQNISSQLQLLKAQIHPHFLFNTLNNIYSHTQVASPNAPRLVAGLSDLLRYILYQCNQPLVPLRNELKMLQNYILLEQIRYHNQLDLSMDIPKDDENLLIAPLLLLPLVENSFKHGASQILEHPWIALSLSIKDKQLNMKLLNGKSPFAKNTSSGIGISNLRARLELLYPEQHQFRISQTEETFIVSLNLELEKAPLIPVSEKSFATHV